MVDAADHRQHPSVGAHGHQRRLLDVGLLTVLVDEAACDRGGQGLEVGVDGGAHRDRSGYVAERTTIDTDLRSEEHTSELQSLMRISYAVFCVKKKKTQSPSPE